MKPGSDPRSPWVIVAGGFHRSGGMDKANLALAEHLVSVDIPVHLVSYSIDEKLASHPLVICETVARPGGIYAIGDQLLNLKGRAVAKRVLSSHPGAKVVVNGGNCIWPAVNWIHYVHEAWRVIDTGGPWWFRSKQAAVGWIAREMERRAIEQAHLILTNSLLTRQHILKFFRVDPTRVINIYLGAEDQWMPPTSDDIARAKSDFGVPPNRAVVSFVGALGMDHRKGFDVLFEAWERLCRRPDWECDLYVAGSGIALEYWRGRVMQAGLSSRIRMLGFCDRVRDLLAVSDLLISPVRYEPYGLNVQEALCCGIPAMVSVRAGIAERYPDDCRNLLIRDPESADEVEAHLLAWYASRGRWKDSFLRFGNELRTYGWSTMAARIVDAVNASRF